MDDAVRAGWIEETDVPRDLTAVLGASRGQWLDVIVRDVVETSRNGEIGLSPAVRDALNALKDFQVENVYRHPLCAQETGRAQRMLRLLVDHFLSHPDAVPPDVRRASSGDPPARSVCDFVAGMTDRYAIRAFADVFVVQGKDGR
jgi:dGTPase